MERYGCLVIGVIIALIILTITVSLAAGHHSRWSGWLNRPVGHSPAPAAYDRPATTASFRTSPVPYKVILPYPAILAQAGILQSHGSTPCCNDG